MIIWVILFLIDILMTYYTIKILKEIPSIEESKLEKNALPKILIKKFGLRKGLFIHFLTGILLIFGVGIWNLFTKNNDFLIFITLFLVIGFVIFLYIKVIFFNHIPNIRTGLKLRTKKR
jgi:hypothetical protein